MFRGSVLMERGRLLREQMIYVSTLMGRLHVDITSLHGKCAIRDTVLTGCDPSIDGISDTDFASVPHQR